MIQSYSKRDECVTYKKGKNSISDSSDSHVSFAVELKEGNRPWYRFHTCRLSRYVKYIENNRTKNVHIHDLITNDEPVRLYFDMDIKGEEMRTLFYALEKLQRDAPFSNGMAVLMGSIRRDYDKGLTDSESIRNLFYTICLNHVFIAYSMQGRGMVKESDFVLTSACREGKFSAHIVCNDLVLENAQKLEEFVTLFRIRIAMLFMESKCTLPIFIFDEGKSKDIDSYNIRDMFDMSVYPFDSSCKSLRTIYSSKMDTPESMLKPHSFTHFSMYDEKRRGGAFQPIVVSGSQEIEFSTSLIERCIPITPKKPEYFYSYHPENLGIHGDAPLSVILNRMKRLVQCSVGRVMNPTLPIDIIQGFCSQLNQEKRSLPRGTKIREIDSSSLSPEVDRCLHKHLEPHIRDMRDRFGSILRSKYKSRKVSIYPRSIYVTIADSPCFGRGDISKRKSDNSVRIDKKDGLIAMHCHHTKCHNRNLASFGTTYFPIGEMSISEIADLCKAVGDVVDDKSASKKRQFQQSENDAHNCKKKAIGRLVNKK